MTATNTTAYYNLELIFAVKVKRAYPKCGITEVGSCQAHNNLARVVVTDMDKHSILLQFGFNIFEQR